MKNFTNFLKFEQLLSFSSILTDLCGKLKIFSIVLQSDPSSYYFQDKVQLDRFSRLGFLERDMTDIKGGKQASQFLYDSKKHLLQDSNEPSQKAIFTSIKLSTIGWNIWKSIVQYIQYYSRVDDRNELYLDLFLLFQLRHALSPRAQNLSRVRKIELNLNPRKMKFILRVFSLSKLTSTIFISINR